ncbi:lysophosphatidylserine lipase ABHD12-like isoform X2 [Penaeus japonicus]|nr:lysophosphatidylserine lipase ABHD12-like isoform X2 [Penaeus japonicus]XP_042861394.1 lysophosphatidylserine lipase ABHD12-like isoform X2 [Penaeus japonicus]XP_042861395.1 lysophosphatidylserine lipase ABHD12-like isoform X2 [Penaeus japonicus]XP_042861396.1 lysophosphatidylserine lipase ABHD12-like isoform X2 [Penaeus japonicus]XP_042861397.1 lysophosphatidylserine lipase ABHD12-like isoform X2 [Penaeus japonicus]XP_042861398.1 lysophosphatidylserine lipase ABHD12-like isoform X2 [Penaeu
MFKKLLCLFLIIMLWMSGIDVKTVLIGTTSSVFVVYVVVPLFWHYSTTLQRQLIFLNYVRIPLFFNLEQPEKKGLPGTRTFFLETEKNVKVGVWHVLPESLVSSAPKKDAPNCTQWFEKSLSDSRPVVLYLHGNAGTRAIPHRVELYDLLRKMDYHVIAFDYRGYGDSSFVHVSENGVVQDAKAVYRYLKEKVGSSPLFLWGHSLGTGISTHALRDLCLDGERPSGLVLESPFNNMKEEVKSCFLTAIFRRMPKFDWLFLSRLAEIGAAFRTDEHIAYVNAPIIILHALNDCMVPFELGQKLFKTAKGERPQTLPPIKFVEFDAKYGHDYICRAPDLPQIIREFFREALEGKK